MQEILDYPTSNDYQVADSASNLKVPPHSIEAEQAVLGGLMLDKRAWEQIADRIVEDDFYRHDHKLIFRSIAKLESTDKPFDVVTLSDELSKTHELEDAGGLAYLGQLAKDTPSAANIQAYADIVRERSVLRQLIEIGTDIAGSAYNPEGRDSKELLDEAERQVFTIAEQGNHAGNGFKDIKQLLTTTVEQIDQLFEQEGTVTGVTTGFRDFDEQTSGLQKGDLVIVAGRPSMGKTTFSMNIAENAAIAQGFR